MIADKESYVYKLREELEMVRNTHSDPLEKICQPSLGNMII